jgi:predicted hydrocarbon binding protein
MPRRRAATASKLLSGNPEKEERTMETIITLSGADKAGSLARAVVFLTRKGYVVKGQRITELPSGARLLKIRLALAQVDKELLSAEFKALDPEYNVLSVAFDGDGASDKTAQTPAQSAAALIKEMASQFPHIVALVRAYGGAFGAEAREQALFEAGKKLGGFHYRKEWSFGSPLRMPAALRRALVPAIEKFCAVEATDTQIALPESPFCGAGDQVNCCDFVTGFMQGFLDAGPLSMYTTVQQATCRAKGHTHCTYTVTYKV